MHGACKFLNFKYFRKSYIKFGLLGLLDLLSKKSPIIFSEFNSVSDKKNQKKIIYWLDWLNSIFKINHIRAVRPVFRQKPAYFNLKKYESLFFHTIDIGL